MASSTEADAPQPISTVEAVAPPPSAGRAAGVARATGIVMAFTLLSRILGMLRDSVINYQMGADIHADAYTAAFKVADMLMYLVAGGALASTLIPAFTEYMHNEDEESAWKTFSVVTTVTFAVSAVFVVVCEIWTPLFVHLLNGGYDEERIALAVPLARIILPAQICFMVGSLLNGIQNARGQFLLPALAPSIYNLGIMLGAIFLFSSLGPAGMMWGGLAGALIGNFGLQIFNVRRLGARFRPSFDIAFPGAVKVWKLLVPILLGVSFTNVDQIVNGFFAADPRLAYGSQAVLTYANRLELIPIGVFAQAMGIAILPAMASLAAAGRMEDLKATINRGLRTIFFITFPASALLFVLAVPIIVILSQHGKFDATATVRAAAALQAFCIGIFAWSAHAVLTRSFYALHDSRTPVITGTVMTVVFIGMEWLVVTRTAWGATGLAFATSLAAIIYMVVLYIVLRRRLHGLMERELIASIAKTLAATAAMCLVLWLAKAGCEVAFGDPTRGTVPALGVLILPGAAGVLTYAVAARILKMSEIAGIGGLLGKLRRRKAA
jgi:putative peptidoglycan lipid II flippase